jgi:hypothetical protein
MTLLFSNTIFLLISHGSSAIVPSNTPTMPLIPQGIKHKLVGFLFFADAK